MAKEERVVPQYKGEGIVFRDDITMLVIKKLIYFSPSELYTANIAKRGRSGLYGLLIVQIIAFKAFILLFSIADKTKKPRHPSQPKDLSVLHIEHI